MLYFLVILLLLLAFNAWVYIFLVLNVKNLLCSLFSSLDFPDSEKLILFIINVWSDIFVFQGAINKAMQLVVRQSASNEMLACFSAYLNWEQVWSAFIVRISFCLHWSLCWLNQIKQLTSDGGCEDTLWICPEVCAIAQLMLLLAAFLWLSRPY